MPLNFAFVFGRPIVEGSDVATKQHDDAMPPAIVDQRRLESEHGEEKAPKEESDSFQGVFRTGQKGHPAKKAGLVAFRHEHFHGAFRAHLRQIFGDARKRLAAHHVRALKRGEATSGFKERQQAQGKRLNAEAELEVNRSPCVLPASRRRGS